MKTVKVDDTRRIQLPMLAPGDYYVSESLGGNSILLHKVQPPPRQMSKAEVLAALDESPIRFKGNWDTLKKTVR